MRHPKLPHLQEEGYPVLITFRTAGVVLPPAARAVVVGAATHFDAERYVLYQVVCMPDHVHLLLSPLPADSEEPSPLSPIVQGLKGFTSHRINRLMGRQGTLWQRGYYDRLVRGERDFDEKLRYIVENPLRAGLVRNLDDYEFCWNRWYHGEARDGVPRAGLGGRGL